MKLPQILQPVYPHDLTLPLELKFAKRDKIVSGWKHGDEVLRKHEILVQFLHDAFQTESCVNCIADDGRISHRNLADVATRDTTKVKRDSNPERCVGSGPDPVRGKLKNSQGDIKANRALSPLLVTGRPVGEQRANCR